MIRNSKSLESIINKNLNFKKKIKLDQMKKFKIGEEIDSLKFITILADISKKLKIEMNTENIAKIKTLEDLIKILKLK
jgi:acyl carrier protein